KSSFTIYDGDDQKRLVRDILLGMSMDPKVHNPRGIVSYIDSAKNRLGQPNEKEAARGDVEERVFAAYQRSLRAANAVDFNDLIGLMVKLFQEHPFILERYQDRYRYLMVDEYQDTNHTQYKLIQLLAGKHKNLAVVGDDDQSIYAFRGADVTNILSFEKDFPDVATIRLERNYRSTQTILEAAGAVVSNNRGRMEKTMWTDADKGPKVGMLIGSDEHREAELVVQKIRHGVRAGGSMSDYAVIYRSNAASRAFEQALLAAKIPHVLVGAQKFYERREIRDIVSYIKLLLNPADDMAFRRVINEPPRGIGAKSVADLDHEAKLRGVPLFEAARGWAMRGRGKARTSAGAFCQLIDTLAREALEATPGDLVRKIVERTGYEERLKSQNTHESLGRLENIQELISALDDDRGDMDEEGLIIGAPEEEGPIERLQRFLDKISLSSPTELIPGEDQGQVTLLTAHLAKGLEFPVVFVAGMYEGGFPHFRAMEREEDIEEERRLIYVAFTRARQKLFITRPRQRLMFNGGSASRQDAMPSRFISEIPQELLDFSDAGAFARQRQRSLGSETRADRAARLGFGASSSSSSRAARASGRLFPGRAAPTGAPSSSAPGGLFAPPPEAAPVDMSEVRTVVPEDVAEFAPGVRIVHPKFGLGTIEQRSGPPANLKLQIQFDRHGWKSILARYARLELVLS
ncbi:MAG: DNA helicase-2/ATP-dependent DNA helicase PcrA, partial [Myxococcota bacterium]